MTPEDLTDQQEAGMLPSSLSLNLPALEVFPGQYPSERQLKEDIDKLKNPEPYRARYESAEVQELVQAIDLLDRLKRSAFLNSTDIGYTALVDAKIYLDRRLKDHLQPKG
jgi:hypothetical protein